MVTKDDWVHVCQNVKDQCTSIAKGLTTKLDKQFLAQDLMNATSIIYPQYNLCRTPTVAKCGGEAQHLEKSRVGVLRDSRMFRARQQGLKHLAWGCSWCHWKGLEV